MSEVKKGISKFVTTMWLCFVSAVVMQKMTGVGSRTTKHHNSEFQARVLLEIPSLRFGGYDLERKISGLTPFSSKLECPEFQASTD